MRLLVIGPSSSNFNVATDIAISKGAQVSLAHDIESALSNLRSGKGADLIMIDASYDIASLTSSLNSEHINVPIIACGINNNASDAVRAIHAGAKEYIPLPPDAKMIGAVLSAITDNDRPNFCKSPQMQRVMAMVEKISVSDANVLITGQSGCGKEVIANIIHQKSKRHDKPFIRVNCAAIPDHLLESELFGHEKGAFTGAIAQRIGKFEESSGGTLLLDEISEMDVRLQAKLLRAIQEKEIDRVGGTTPIKVDLRILATSNRNLPEEINKGNFREDLYFRLNIINIELPPLNERREDIIDLTNHFITKYSQNNSLPVKALSPEAEEMVLQYHWPGNVRELENTMHRAVLLATEDKITPADLQIDHNKSRADFQVKTLQDAEQEIIRDTLKYCLGDMNNAANILGISITSLQKKLDVYGKNKRFEPS